MYRCSRSVEIWPFILHREPGHWSCHQCVSRNPSLSSHDNHSQPPSCQVAIWGLKERWGGTLLCQVRKLEDRSLIHHCVPHRMSSQFQFSTESINQVLQFVTVVGRNSLSYIGDFQGCSFYLLTNQAN